MAHSTLKAFCLALAVGGCVGGSEPAADEKRSAPLAIETIAECQRWLADGDTKANAAASEHLREKLRSEARGRRQALTRLAENPATRPTLREHCRKLAARAR